jgi:hypothetical protein
LKVLVGASGFEVPDRLVPNRMVVGIGASSIRTETASSNDGTIKLTDNTISRACPWATVRFIDSASSIHRDFERAAVAVAEQLN